MCRGFMSPQTRYASKQEPQRGTYISRSQNGRTFLVSEVKFQIILLDNPIRAYSTVFYCIQFHHMPKKLYILDSVVLSTYIYNNYWHSIKPFWSSDFSRCDLDFCSCLSVRSLVCRTRVQKMGIVGLVIV